MEDLNMWLSFYMNESGNLDFPIRRFCPARMEQDQEEECHDQERVLDDVELCTFDTTTTPCLLPSSEVDDFADSFINMDQYEDQESQEKNHQSFDPHFLVNDDIFEYDPTTMEDEELEICENTTITMENEEVEMNGNFGAIPQSQASLSLNQSLDLVHTLLACAEAVGCGDHNQANLLLGKILALSSPSGDSN